MRVSKTFFAVALVSLFSVNLLADDVAAQIRAGESAYNSKNYAKAIEELNFAIQQIQQLQQDNLGEIMPSPLSGWTAEDVENANVGAAMLGGGAVTSRKYKKGNQSVKIEMVTNSPLMSSMMMAFSNPMFMGRKNGSRLMKVHGEKAMKEFKNGKGKVTIILDNKILLMVEGKRLGDDSPLMDYANALDFSAIRKALNT